MHAMYEIILQCYGWDRGWRIIQGIAGNVKNFTGTASQVGKEIATAEIVYGLAIDTYAGDIIRRVGADRISYLVPEECRSVNGDGIAVLKGAPSIDLASGFVQFVLSERGQRLFYARRGEVGASKQYDLGKLPVIPDIYSSVATASVVKGNPFSWDNILAYDAPRAAVRWNLVNDIFGVFILDAHDRLVRKAQGVSDEARKDGARYPSISIAEDQAVLLADQGRWGRDAALRTDTLRRWAHDASQGFAEPRGYLEYLKAVPGIAFLLVLLIGAARRLVRLGGF
jgi:hypothetical protein